MSAMLSTDDSFLQRYIRVLLYNLWLNGKNLSTKESNLLTRIGQVDLFRLAVEWTLVGVIGFPVRSPTRG